MYLLCVSCFDIRFYDVYLSKDCCFYCLGVEIDLERMFWLSVVKVRFEFEVFCFGSVLMWLGYFVVDIFVYIVFCSVYILCFVCIYMYF